MERSDGGRNILPGREDLQQFFPDLASLVCATGKKPRFWNAGKLPGLEFAFASVRFVLLPSTPWPKQKLPR
jgi:hypothetical protein